MSKYRLDVSAKRSNRYVLTDIEYLVVIEFDYQRFNETQHTETLDESKLISSLPPQEAASKLAGILSAMGDWLWQHHPSLCMDVEYGIEEVDEEDKCYLCHYHTPKWRCELQDSAYAMDIAESLSDAAVWLIKQKR